MNAQISNLYPLTIALQTQAFAAAHPARRRFVDHAPVQPKGLDHFNRLLAQLCYTPLDSETPASVPFGRRSESGDQPDCLATVVSRMLGDPGWQIDEQAIVPAHLVVEKIAVDSDAGGSPVSATGQFYFATVIDAAWSRLIEEVDCYLDFCRIRTIEAGMRGCDVMAFVFGRGEWQLARRAEAALGTRRHRMGSSSYRSSVANTGFRVC